MARGWNHLKSSVLRLTAWGIALSAVALCSSSAHARIEVSVTRVGFPTVSSGHVYRVGEWTPVIVDVDLLDQSTFDGVIRIAQPDVDGDQVIDSVEVHLSAETGGSIRRFLYVLANPQRGNDEQITVELLNSEGEAVEVASQGVATYKAAPPQQPTAIAESDILILSVSTGTIGRVRELAELNTQGAYYPSVHVAHVSPSEMPDLSAGLAAVDYVVWDDADPADLTERQRMALLDWLESGGTLVMAAARRTASIEQSPFARHMPVKLGSTRTVDNLPTTRRLLIGPERADDERITRRRAKEDEVLWHDVPYASPVLLSDAELLEGGRILGGEPLSEPGQDSEVVPALSPIVTERWAGDGRLIFCAITFKDLLSGPDHAAEFFEKLFYLRKQNENDNAPPQEFSLFGFVVGAVAFSTSSNVYLTMAILFSITYVIIATGGVWWFMGRRCIRHHTWSGFGVVAMAATVVSVFSVGWVRGVAARVHQLSIVDMDTRASHARGIVFFGLKTPTDQEVDLWLPSDPSTALEPGAEACRLRPMPPGSDATDTQLGFADPESYQVVPGSALIEGVRIRSTLKRFEGQWSGPIDGYVDGSVVMNRDGTLGEESFVHNHLAVDLENCYLLHAQLDPFDTQRGTLAPMPRDAGIYAYPIKVIPAQTRIDLASECNPKPDPARPGVKTPVPRLEERHKAWSQPLIPSFNVGFGQDDPDFALGQEQNALLLASTIGELDTASLLGMGYFPGARMWTRDRLRRLDLRSHLRRDEAVLVGFAKDPGPMRLFRRTGSRSFRAMEPDASHSTTMYRVRIPVRWPERGESAATTVGP